MNFQIKALIMHCAENICCFIATVQYGSPNYLQKMELVEHLKFFTEV